MTMPEWLEFLLKGLNIFAMMAFSAIVATKAGKSPYYAVCLLFPFVQVALVWVFALRPWARGPDDAPG